MPPSIRARCRGGGGKLKGVDILRGGALKYLVEVGGAALVRKWRHHQRELGASRETHLTGAREEVPVLSSLQRLYIFRSMSWSKIEAYW